MIYAIGYSEFIKEGEHRFTIKDQIKKEEYEGHLSSLGEATKLKTMNNIYNLFERNGKEFLKYTSEIPAYLESDEDKESIYMEANRLLINYLSSLSMFIDYGKKFNKKHFGKQKMDEFLSKTHKFYDSHVSYRFMAIMRNYALHYGFPLTHIKRSLTKKNGIFSSKETLLKFKEWKHAKEDIEKMPNDILLEPHVKVSMLFIKHLYESYIYDIAPSVVKGLEYLNEMIKENGGKVPLLAAYKNLDEFKKGNILFDYIEPKAYLDSLKIIQSHPSINVDIVENKS
ncbi:hypothetical protein [Lysinibacillus sp. RC79]|uniref:hypothetical protein n=1 Tax=Lysinibacillus sp. RC79 TaxID=3156296 RepID=UPI0035114EB2